MTGPTPASAAAALAEQERVLKPVEQIKAEWKAIEAKRPGGRMDAVLGLLENADRAGKTTAQESRLISVIRTLHDTVGDYHAEMGILLAAHAEALERADKIMKHLQAAHDALQRRADEGRIDFNIAARVVEAQLEAAKRSISPAPASAEGANLAPPPVEEISAEEFARRESPYWAHVENAVEYVRAGRGDPQPTPPAPADAQLREELALLRVERDAYRQGVTSKALTPHSGLHGRLSVLWLGHCQGCRQEFRNELGGALATDGKVYCEDCWDTNCDQQENLHERPEQPEFTDTWATKRIQELELEVAFANANYRQALDNLKHEMDKVGDLQEQVWRLQGIAPEEAQAEGGA